MLCYLYQAAVAAGETETMPWALYVRWMTACWQGKVSEVIEEVTEWHERMGGPPEAVEKPGPRKIVAESWTYLKNNQDGMEYARYRREGCR